MENKPKSKLDIAWEYFEKNEYLKAIKLCNSILKIKKHALTANYYLGLIKHDQKEFGDALSYLQKALELSYGKKSRGYIYYWIGRVHEYDDFFENSNPVYDKPKSIDAYNNAKNCESYPSDTISRLVFSRQQTNEKIGLYEDGIRKFPREADFYVALAKLYKNLGYLSKQIETLDLAISNETESASLLFNLARYNFENKKYPECESYLRLCLELNNNDRALPLIYYSLGNCLFKQDYIEKAIESYNDSIKASGVDNGIWYGVMGLVIAYKEEERIELIKSLISSIPLDTKLYNYISFSYGLMSYFDGEAMEELELEQEPKALIKILEKVRIQIPDKTDSIKIGILLATLYEYNENLLLKLQVLRTCSTDLPGLDFIGDEVANVYYKLAESNMFDEKVEELFIIDLRSRAFESYLKENVLASIINKLFKDKSYKKVVSICKNLRDPEIENYEILFDYAYSLANESRADDAQKYYELQIKQQPSNSAALNNLGVIYEKKEDYLKAISLFKGAIKGNPDHELYRNNLKNVTHLSEKKIKEQKQKIIPDNWGSAIKNINVETLEDFDYFNIIAKIEKVNKKFRTLIDRDFKELSFNYLVGNHKSTIVMAGSLVELILTYFCEKKNYKTIQIKNNKDVLESKKLYDSVLNDLINFIENKKLFGNDFQHLGNLARVYRNFIHPGLELKTKAEIKTKANICFISTLEILKKII